MFTIAHYREWEGYFSSWYDLEGGVEGATNTFTL